MSNRSAYSTFLRNYYLASSLYDFVFAYAVYNLLFSLRGMSILEISMLLSWWAAMALVLEIPSGALADRWSRKRMLVIAPLFKSLCFITWFFADASFYLFALGFFFWALGSSFVSGTTESLLYDTLKNHQQTHNYEKVLGRKKFYYHIALAVSILLGGLIAEFDIEWAILLSVVPLLLSSLFASRLTDAPRTESHGTVNYLDYIRIAWQEVKSTPVLKYLFIYSVGVFILAALEEYDQLYYKLVNLPLYGFGIAGLIWSLTSAISSFYAHKLKDQNWCYYVIPFVSFVLLVLVARYPSVPMIGVLFAAYFIAAPLNILVGSRIQHNIRSVSRATVTSAHAFACTLFGLLALLGFGVIGRVWNLQAIYYATAWLLLGVAVLTLLSIRRITR
jgi:MFS family permease